MVAPSELPNGKYRFILRLAALLGFLVSFTGGSTLVFYALPISTYLFIHWRLKAGGDIKHLPGMMFGILDFIFLPPIYWYLKSIYFTSSGMFSGYNALSIDISVFVKPFLPILGFFSGDGLAIGTGGLVIVLALLVLSSYRISIFFPQSIDNSIKISLIFIIIGVAVSYLGVFPYAAVGKIPSFSDWTATRHQRLLMFGLAIIIFGVVSACARKFKENSHAINTILPLFIVLLFIGNWWQVYSEFYVDHLKQRALIKLIKKHPELKKNNVIIVDTTKLTALNSKTGLGEYAAIYAETTSLHNSLILDYDIINHFSGWKKYTENFARFLGVWSNTQGVDLSIKPSLYILRKTVNIDSKLSFSIKMLLARIFHHKSERDIISNMLVLDGPFPINP